MRKNLYKNKIMKLFKGGHLLSISDIHKKMSDVNYSTVYRNVEQLLNDGDIKKVVLDKDRIMYEINSKGRRHDHFVCTECGSVDEIHGPIKSGLGPGIFSRYVITDVLLRGLCNKCH